MGLGFWVYLFTKCFNVVFACLKNLFYCCIAEINDHLANSPAYLVAMECITFLLKEGLETDKIFRIPGNVGKLKKYLEVVDSYKVSVRLYFVNH